MFRCSSLIFGCGESFSLRTTHAFTAFFLLPFQLFRVRFNDAFKMVKKTYL